MKLANKSDVLQCLANVGIIIDADETDEDIFIVDYIGDSILFISFIIELEEMFGFEMPDEYLVTGEFETLNDICSLVNMQLKGENK